MKNEFFNGNGILERNKIQLVQTLLQFEDILLSPVQIQSLLDGSIKEKIKLDHEGSIVVRNVIKALDFLNNCNLETLKLNSDLYIHLNVTANFLPPRIFNSKLLQYPKAKVI